jgi:hypothetical protein
VHLGAELALRRLHTVFRGGYAYYPDPLQSAPKSRDRELLTGGLRFAIDQHIGLDVTYLHGRWERTNSDVYTPGGTEEQIAINRLLVGFGYTF